MKQTILACLFAIMLIGCTKTSYAGGLDLSQHDQQMHMAIGYGVSMTVALIFKRTSSIYVINETTGKKHLVEGYTKRQSILMGIVTAVVASAAYSLLVDKKKNLGEAEGTMIASGLGALGAGFSISILDF